MATKTNLEILEIAEIIYRSKTVSSYLPVGICPAINLGYDMYGLNQEDVKRFFVIFRKYLAERERDVYYDLMGDETDDKTEFAWDPYDRPARLACFAEMKAKAQ